VRSDIDGPYERRGIRSEKRVYIAIVKIIVVTIIILVGIHTINQLDDIMTQQRIQDKTMTDAMDQLMWIRQDIDELDTQLQTLQEDIEKLKSKPVSLGEFTISHYCLEDYPHICNDGDPSHTASMKTPIPYYTIAADPSVPFGTKVYIGDREYEVMDRGGDIVGRRIDLCVPTHEEALELGMVKREVFIPQ